EAGELTTLAECPVGLFLSDGGELCFKSEYGDNNGRIDAYIVRSGEFFWGAPPQTIASQRRQVVRPVARPAPEVKDAAAPLTMPVAHDPRYPSSGCSTKTVQGTLYNATKPTTPAPAASDELVERLRAVTEADAYAAPWTFGEKCREAAAEMERKDARIAHLEVEKDFISAEYLRSAKALHCNWRSHDPDASAAKDLEKVLWDADHKAAAALRPAKGGRDGE
ncbi:hypothetical protein, partial [Ancylobacter polymorphus]